MFNKATAPVGQEAGVVSALYFNPTLAIQPMMNAHVAARYANVSRVVVRAHSYFRSAPGGH
jgi:hypothetical protein